MFTRVEEESPDKGDFDTGNILAIRTGVRPQTGDVVLARNGGVPTLRRVTRADARGTVLNPAIIGTEPNEVGETTQDTAIIGIVLGGIIGTRPTKN